MRIFALFIAAFVLYLATDTVVGLAREFEHGIDDSRIKRQELHEIEWHSMIATAYCLTGTTATNTEAREGIAASKREWFGKKAQVYWNDNGSPGKLIGEYTIEDTGGEPIQNGSVIDIWMPTEDECFAFGRRLVLVKIMEE